MTERYSLSFDLLPKLVDLTYEGSGRTVTERPSLSFDLLPKLVDLAYEGSGRTVTERSSLSFAYFKRPLNSLMKAQDER